MGLGSAIVSFALVAGLVTLTPGIDTALVLRTALARPTREAFATAAGIATGCLVWGVGAALGVSALLTASTVAFTVLRGLGALYMGWLGIRLILAAIRGTEPDETEVPGRGGVAAAFRQGFFTNLMNPKVGAFYVALLPQFIPPGEPAALVGLLLAGVHAVEGMAWFAILIAAAGWLAPRLRSSGVRRWMDAVAGTVIIGFGLKLALDRG